MAGPRCSSEARARPPGGPGASHVFITQGWVPGPSWPRDQAGEQWALRVFGERAAGRGGPALTPPGGRPAPGPALTPRGGGPAPGPALTPQGRTGRRPRLRSCSRCARSAHTGPARTGRTPPSRPRRARTTSRLSTPPQPGLCGRNTGQSNGDREPWRGGRPSPPGGQRAALLQRLTHRQSICAEALRLDPFTRAPGQLRPTWNCHHPEVGSPG